MPQETPAIGQLIPEGSPAFRDAVHVAIAPAVAGEILDPGDAVSLKEGAAFLDGGRAIGIVDPFLKASVEPGERFYIFLFPNTVTSLRHVWTHPAFSTMTPLSQKETPPK